MAKNFFDFCDEKIEKPKEETCFNKESCKVDEEQIKEDINTTYNKYKDLSQDDLMSEFIKVSKEKKKNGDLNQNNINKLIGQLSPFLNDEQKQRLKDLLNKIDV